MRTCPKCKEEIKDKATKCPHCQSDLRNWFLRHPLITIILLLFVIPFFIVSTVVDNQKNSINLVEGKYAYNLQNNVFIGRVIEEKNCRTTPSVRCYLINSENENGRQVESPVSNVILKDTPPVVSQ